MARRTVEILQDSEKRAAMSTAARHRAQELSLEKATERLVDFLHSLAIQPR